MNIAYIIIIAMSTSTVVAAVIVVLLRRGAPLSESTVEVKNHIKNLETELSGLRDTNNQLERRLAVEEQKALRMMDVERELVEKVELLDTLKDDKATVEQKLAVTSETLDQTRGILTREQERATELEGSTKALLDRLEKLRAEKSKQEEALAVSIQAATGLENTVKDLRQRLEVADRNMSEQAAHTDVIKGEKAALEKLIGQQATLVEERTAMIENLRKELDNANAALATAQKDYNDLQIQHATLKETIEQITRQSEEKLSLLHEARENMAKEFKVLAEEVMARHGENFSKQNKEQLDGILTPLRDKLVEFHQSLQTAQTESTKERATLAEQIRTLTESSAKMTQETNNLTKALKGKSQTQGAWGEMILSKILEQSGLREGEEYTAQESYTADDGSRLRPDVVVNLPNGQHIIIDSKVSLTAFEAFVNAESDGDRALYLKSHITSMRTHIKTLGGKEYQTIIGDLDYVIMFVPIEGAFATAVQEDPTITTFAVEQNVAITTPNTLMIALRTVANIWQVERRNRNAEAIAERAGKIYDKFIGFLNDMTELGIRVNRVSESYDNAMGKLSTGRGNMVRQIEQLKEMGARTTKSLPQALLDDERSVPLIGQEKFDD